MITKNDVRSQMISELFGLSIRAQRTKSLKVKQLSRMKAGKIRKQLYTSTAAI
jgi:hypothetical protein